MSAVANDHTVAYGLALDYVDRINKQRQGKADYRDIISREYYCLLFIIEALVILRASMSQINNQRKSAHDRYLNLLEPLYSQDDPTLIGFSRSLEEYKRLRMFADYGKGLRTGRDISEAQDKRKHMQERKKLNDMTMDRKRLFELYEKEVEKHGKLSN